MLHMGLCLLAQARELYSPNPLSPHPCGEVSISVSLKNGASQTFWYNNVPIDGRLKIFDTPSMNELQV